VGASAAAAARHQQKMSCTQGRLAGTSSFVSQAKMASVPASWLVLKHSPLARPLGCHSAS